MLRIWSVSIAYNQHFKILWVILDIDGMGDSELHCLKLEILNCGPTLALPEQVLNMLEFLVKVQKQSLVDNKISDRMLDIWQ